MSVERTDLVVVGGGINGCGIARDAVGRGLSVRLVEKSDLASATSSASTKLIHGGLRYLEYYEFRLVREALLEREVLLCNAPHLIEPLTFVLPHDRGLRPAWLIRLGLYLYDHLGGRKILASSRGLDLRRDPVGEPLQARFRRGFEYADCRVDDSRLVALNAVDAAERGANIHTRTECIRATRSGAHWQIELLERRTGRTWQVEARALVNAGGPWVSEFIVGRAGLEAKSRVRLVKGSHIILPRIYAHDRAYLFQNGDGRIVFAIPYQGRFTLIGTTEVDFSGDPASVAISDQEIVYLCSAVSEYFKVEIRPGDVVHSFAGVRPLYDDGASEAKAATRDYVLELDAPEMRPDGEGGAPLLNIFGGKITTYRRLAEAALDKLAGYFPQMGGNWTKIAPLPGGDFRHDGFGEVVRSLEAAVPWLEPDQAARLAHAYGTRAKAIFADGLGCEGVPRSFGAGLTEPEVHYLIENEWAMTADDVLWRRSKLGLHVTADERTRLEAFMDAQCTSPDAATPGAGLDTVEI